MERSKLLAQALMSMAAPPAPASSGMMSPSQMAGGAPTGAPGTPASGGVDLDMLRRMLGQGAP